MSRTGAPLWYSPPRSNLGRPTSIGSLWQVGWLVAAGSALLTYCLAFPRPLMLAGGLGSLVLLGVLRIRGGTTVRRAMTLPALRIPWILLFLSTGLALIPYFANPADPAPMAEGILYLFNCGLALLLLGVPFPAGSRGVRAWLAALGVVGVVVAAAAWSDTFGFTQFFWRLNQGTAIPPVSRVLGTRVIPGIVWNVNYFSVACAIGAAALLPLAFQASGRRRTLFLVLSASLGVSVLVTFSRGVVAASAVAALFLLWWFARHRSRWLLVVGGVVAGGLFITGAAAEIGGVALLFQEKGLNNRDVLWSAAYRAIQGDPVSFLFGIGHANAAEALLEHNAGKGTTQSSYVYALLTAGVLGLLVRLALLAYPLLLVLRSAGRLRGDPELGAAIAILLVVALDGLFRTYSLGGLGYAPMALTTAWAACIGLASTQRLPWERWPAPQPPPPGASEKVSPADRPLEGVTQ
jgi:hypothetical protein